MKIPISGHLFMVEEVDGPIHRNGMHFPVRIRYADQTIELLKTLPEHQKKWVLAAAISEAAVHYRIPLIWPKWDKQSENF